MENSLLACVVGLPIAGFFSLYIAKKWNERTDRRFEIDYTPPSSSTNGGRGQDQLVEPSRPTQPARHMPMKYRI